jgi:hypothetical protein
MWGESFLDSDGVDMDKTLPLRIRSLSGDSITVIIPSWPANAGQ